jgi:hypothetical protein
VTPATRFDQRIYAMDEWTRLAAWTAPCVSRTAGPTLVLDWMTAFTEEALHGADDPERIERSVDAARAGGAGGICLWETAGRAVSLAGFGGSTPNGLRSARCTRLRSTAGTGTGAPSPQPPRRSRSIAASARFLYTDLANPTSNAIYTRIGYRPVCDSREIAFAGRRG